MSMGLRGPQMGEPPKLPCWARAAAPGAGLRGGSGSAVPPRGSFGSPRGRDAYGVGVERRDERVAIVTGAASGIGLGIAEQLAAAGARVVMADLDEANLE